MLRRNRNVPAGLPGMLAAAGRLGKAEGLARGMADPSRGSALTAVARQAAQTHPAVAEALLGELVQQVQRDDVLAVLVESAARNDLGRAADLLGAVGSERRDAMIERIAAVVPAERAGEIAAVVAPARAGPRRAACPHRERRCGGCDG